MLFKTIAERLREKTTWAGIAVLLGLFGVPAPIVGVLGSLLDFAPSVVDALQQGANVVAIGGGAAVAMLTPETPSGP